MRCRESLDVVFDSSSYRYQIIVECFESLFSTPFKTWFPVVLSAIALALPTGLYMTASNVKFFSFFLQQPPELTVFLAKDIEQSTASLVQQKISELNTVQSAKLISADEALVDFQQLTGLHTVANYLQENPFSTLVIVQPDKSRASLEAFQDLSAKLYQLDYVDLVQFDQEWTAKLFSLRKLASSFGQTAVGLLLIIAVVLICFFGRWRVSDRTDEIKLLSLIGANSSFISRPFIYSAAFQAVLIVLIAFGFVEGFRAVNQQTVADLTSLYGINSVTEGIVWQDWAFILAAVLVINVAATKIAIMFSLLKLEKEMLR